MNNLHITLKSRLLCRDLHTNMCSRYGSAVQFLQFPAKKLFGSKTEAVSSERQRDLSTYLNRNRYTSTIYLFVSGHTGFFSLKDHYGNMNISNSMFDGSITVCE